MESVITDKEKKTKRTKAELEKLKVRFVASCLALSLFLLPPFPLELTPISLPSFRYVQAQDLEVRDATAELELLQEQLQADHEPTKMELEQTQRQLKKVKADLRGLSVSSFISPMSLFLLRFSFADW